MSQDFTDYTEGNNAFEGFSAFQTEQYLGDVYRIVREIGKGGQATVYEAVCAEDGHCGLSEGTRVAIKKYSAIPDQATIKKIEKRFHYCKERLHHPGFVRYIDFFIDDPRGIREAACVVMDLLEGQTLRDRLRPPESKSGPITLDWEETHACFSAIIDALLYAGALGLVHRDIKPSNIHLSNDGQVRLLDFDLAIEAVSESMVTTDFAGTLNYMAPEFLRDNFKGDEVSDIFSLCVCMFEALFGHLPYGSFETPFAFFQKYDDAPKLELPDSKHFKLLQNLNSFFLKGLSLSRDGAKSRYKSFVELREAFLSIQPIRYGDNEHQYELVDYIGSGGFSDVYSGRDVQTGERVAIKIAKDGLSCGRFLKERDLLVKLRDIHCPEVVRYINFIETDDQKMALVMELLPGMPDSGLNRRLRKNPGGLPVEEVFRIFDSYLAGLVALHSVRVWHRDIKPSNLYAPEGHVEDAKILDLGAARIERESHTTGIPPATYEYAPPEYFTTLADSKIFHGSAQGDIYSLGLVLHEALTGQFMLPKLPRERKAALKTAVQRAMKMQRRKSIHVDVTHEVFSKYPGLLEVILKATAPIFKNRYGSAELFRTALREAAAETSEISTQENQVIVRTAEGGWPEYPTGSRVTATIPDSMLRPGKGRERAVTDTVPADGQTVIMVGKKPVLRALGGSRWFTKVAILVVLLSTFAISGVLLKSRISVVSNKLALIFPARVRVVYPANLPSNMRIECSFDAIRWNFLKNNGFVRADREMIVRYLHDEYFEFRTNIVVQSGQDLDLPAPSLMKHRVGWRWRATPAVNVGVYYRDRDGDAGFNKLRPESTFKVGGTYVLKYEATNAVCVPGQSSLFVTNDNVVMLSPPRISSLLGKIEVTGDFAEGIFAKKFREVGYPTEITWNDTELVETNRFWEVCFSRPDHGDLWVKVYNDGSKLTVAAPDTDDWRESNPLQDLREFEKSINVITSSEIVCQYSSFDEAESLSQSVSSHLNNDAFENIGNRNRAESLLEKYNKHISQFVDLGNAAEKICQSDGLLDPSDLAKKMKLSIGELAAQGWPEKTVNAVNKARSHIVKRAISFWFSEGADPVNRTDRIKDAHNFYDEFFSILGSHVDILRDKIIDENKFCIVRLSNSGKEPLQLVRPERHALAPQNSIELNIPVATDQRVIQFEVRGPEDKEVLILERRLDGGGFWEPQLVLKDKLVSVSWQVDPRMLPQPELKMIKSNNRDYFSENGRLEVPRGSATCIWGRDDYEDVAVETTLTWSRGGTILSEPGVETWNDKKTEALQLLEAAEQEQNPNELADRIKALPGEKLVAQFHRARLKKLSSKWETLVDANLIERMLWRYQILDPFTSKDTREKAGEAKPPDYGGDLNSIDLKAREQAHLEGGGVGDLRYRTGAYQVKTRGDLLGERWGELNDYDARLALKLVWDGWHNSYRVKDSYAQSVQSGYNMEDVRNRTSDTLKVLEHISRDEAEKTRQFLMDLGEAHDGAGPWLLALLARLKAAPLGDAWSENNLKVDNEFLNWAARDFESGKDL